MLAGASRRGDHRRADQEPQGGRLLTAHQVQREAALHGRGQRPPARGLPPVFRRAVGRAFARPLQRTKQRVVRIRNQVFRARMRRRGLFRRRAAGRAVRPRLKFPRGALGLVQRLPHAGRHLQFLACKVLVIIRVHRKHQMIGAAEPLQHLIMECRGRVIQLRRKHLGHRLDARLGIARQQPLRGIAKPRAQQSQGHHADHQQVQEEPEDDLGVERERRLHHELAGGCLSSM